jgi:hypothetical protein
MRKLVAGIATGVAVVGLGAAAFAVDGGPGTKLVDDTTTTTTSSTTTSSPSTTSPARSTTVAPKVDAPPVATEPTTSDQGVGTTRSTDGCDGGTYANHGDYVSSVARDSGREPGDVPKAAQSDCGKPVSATGKTPESEPETEAPETETDATPSPKANGTGNSQGNGKGNGKR